MKTLTEHRRVFCLASDEKSCSELQHQVANQLAALAYPEEDIFAARLSLEEALRNAVEHGNQSDPRRVICVEVVIDDLQISIGVEDEGSGFRVADIRDPTLAECIQQLNGRGIFLMKNFMDSVEYNPTGNSVRMTRRRSFHTKEGRSPRSA